jgi:hypothetical protein
MIAAAMKRILGVFLAGICLLGQAAGADGKPNSLTPEEIEAGWILLFDGDTLFGWAPRGPAQWEVADGTIRHKRGSGGGYLSTTTEFADFQLHAEFWIDDQANSGVFLRCPATGEITSSNAYEVSP